jgi:hypothetical protein
LNVHFFKTSLSVWRQVFGACEVCFLGGASYDADMTEVRAENNITMTVSKNVACFSVSRNNPLIQRQFHNEFQLPKAFLIYVTQILAFFSQEIQPYPRQKGGMGLFQSHSRMRIVGLKLNNSVELQLYLTIKLLCIAPFE